MGKQKKRKDDEEFVSMSATGNRVWRMTEDGKVQWRGFHAVGPVLQWIGEWSKLKEP